jgi:hypothetical protein
MRRTQRTAAAISESAIICSLVVAYFAYVFQIWNGAFFNSGLGDWVDPYFINYLLEHWDHALLHLTDPSSPPMFFPVRGTLGYSHGLILYVPFYGAARLFLHPFIAYSASIFLVFITGSTCLYALLRTGIGAGSLESLVLSVFFFTSRNVVTESVATWSQRASVFLLPPIMLLAVVVARMHAGPARLCLAGLTGLLFALMFTQDFYTAQLAVLVMVPLAAGWLLMARQSAGKATGAMWRTAGAHERRGAGSYARRQMRWLIIACVCFAWSTIVFLHPVHRVVIGGIPLSATSPWRPLAIGIAATAWFLLRLAGGLSVHEKPAWLAQLRSPVLISAGAGATVGALIFLWIYLPVYLQHSAFPEGDLMGSLVLVTSGREGWAAAWRGYDSLRTFKFVALLAIVIWLPWSRVSTGVRYYALWVMLVSAVVLLIPLRFNTFSIWKTFFAPVPGLSAIRDPRRIIPLYELAVILMSAYAITCMRHGSPPRIAASLLAALLLLTESNTTQFTYRRDPRVFDGWVQKPIAIDPSCRSFYIRGASDEYMARSWHMSMLYAGDALFVSLDHSIPTLNGYSAWTPVGWALANPQESTYQQNVSRWISQNRLDNVCELDIERRTMSLRQP